MRFDGQVGPVRNIHHFRKDALAALKKNVGDHSRKKPLAVVLHSTVDHNGAFHRDPNIDQIAASPVSTSILVEGSASLDAAGASLEAVVKDYGQGTPPKARQIMLAGHGNSRVTELAGDRDATGAVTDEAVDLDHNASESLDLIKIMLANLDSDPKARIVLNGCLTASASAFPPLPRGATRGGAQAGARRSRQGARGQAQPGGHDPRHGGRQGIKPDQVSAASSSFGNEVSLIDPRTGDLGLRSPDDPLMTSADKFAYVAQAGEATGAGRALVECILADPVKAEALGEGAPEDLQGAHDLGRHDHQGPLPRGAEGPRRRRLHQPRRRDRRRDLRVPVRRPVPPRATSPGARPTWSTGCSRRWSRTRRSRARSRR